MKVDPNGLYSIAEVSQMLNVTTRTIMKRLKNNELLGKKVGNNWIILGTHVLDYLSGDPQIECRLLADELSFYDKRFADCVPAFEQMVRNAPNRPSLFFQLANFMNNVRVSTLNK